jgi:hypothetical protein
MMNRDTPSTSIRVEASSREPKEREKKKPTTDKKSNKLMSWLSDHQQSTSVGSALSKTASEFVIKVLLDEFKAQTKQKIEEMMKFEIVCFFPFMTLFVSLFVIISHPQRNLFNNNTPFSHTILFYGDLG